jgi:hypothetical protein
LTKADSSADRSMVQSAAGPCRGVSDVCIPSHNTSATFAC